jgi:diadenosine tetraphosphate (Ap4A) HIT family hydrolase
VLIPRRAGARELDDLVAADRIQLMEEIITAGAAVRAVGAAIGRPAHKLNVGALGNIVPQLHIHIVGRHVGDAAWPGPVWGAGEAASYAEAPLQRAIDSARAALGSPSDP